MVEHNFFAFHAQSKGGHENMRMILADIKERFVDPADWQDAVHDPILRKKIKT
jgi:hypothetical protein